MEKHEMNPLEVNYGDEGSDIVISGNHEPGPDMGVPNNAPEVRIPRNTPDMGEASDAPDVGHGEERPTEIGPGIQEIGTPSHPGVDPKNLTREEIERIIGKIAGNDPNKKKRIIDELIRRREEDKKDKPTVN